MPVKRLERLLTQHFLATVSLLVGLGWCAFALVVTTDVTIDTAAKSVDAMFKIAAVVGGTAWSLNRYFTARTDELQLRVDAATDFVTSGSDAPIFVCRLDIYNTGKALTSGFREFVVIESAISEGEVIVYHPISRWPDSDLHRAAPIEPGSWSALSFAVPLRSRVPVVRVYLELQFDGGKLWTWHRHFVNKGGPDE